MQPGTVGVGVLAPHPAQTLSLARDSQRAKGGPELGTGQVTPPHHWGEVQMPSPGLDITGGRHKPIPKGSGGD